MSHQGSGRYRPPGGNDDGAPWPGHQPDVHDFALGPSGAVAGYAELAAYRRAGYPDYQVPPVPAGYPGGPAGAGSPDRGAPDHGGIQRPASYQTSAVIIEPPAYRERPAYPPPASYREPVGYQEPASYPQPVGYQEPAGYPPPASYRDPGDYRDPGGYREPAGDQETAWYPQITADPGPDSDEFAAPLINPAPVDAPPVSDGDQDPTAYVGLAPPPPGAGPTPGAWRRRGRGLLAATVAGLLATAVGITVSVLAAKLLRPQASPVTAAGALLRSGPVRNLAGQHAQMHGTTTLAWGIVAIAAVALGLIAGWRRAAGVLGTAAVLGVAVFLVVTRPGSHASDVIPSLVGGAAAVLTLAGLSGAAAPRVISARAVVRVHDGYRRTGDLDVVGTDRRRFLLASLTAGSVAAVAGVGGRLLGRNRTMAAPQEMAGPVQKLPPLPASGKLDRIPGISPFYTPNNAFYRVDTALVVPKVTTQEWKLRIHGMVDKPVTIDFEDLMSRPQLQRDITLICVSESVGGKYIGNARWQGVRLADLLREAGVRPGATQIVMRDVQGMALGVSTQAVMDGRDALLAVKMNGQPLPAEHGYPVRVVVPGLYGYVSACKWVVDMELTTFAAYNAYWTKRGWSEQALVKTESRIDTPKVGPPVKAGLVTIAGVAWATHRGIARVEVGVDGVWAEASLATQDTIDTWRQWSYRWEAAPGTHTLQVRATDLTGHTQTAVVHEPEPNGATGYHTVKVTVA